MNDKAQTKVGDWNSFWSLDKTERFTRESWSKKRIKNILRGYIKDDFRVLDAGCGSGFFSQYFCSLGLKTFSLDYSDSALEICKIKTNGTANLLKKNLLVDDIKRDISEKFDLIFSDGLFEHFSTLDQDKIMNNLKNLLDENGVVVTFVPNKFSPWELIRPFYMPGIKEDPFTLKRLMDLNERNGLSVVDCGGINTFPFRLSPDKIFGKSFGMLLYAVSKKK